jgi:hypothetical protein
MVHGALDHGIAPAACPGQYFSVYERAAAEHFDLVKEFSSVEFEGTVDILDFYTEQGAGEFGPEPAVDFSDEVVFAIEAEAGDDVVFFDKVEERGQLGDIELAVAVGVEDEFFGGGLEAGSQGSAVAFVVGVVYYADARVGGSEGVGDFSGPVAAAIVYDNQLEVDIERREGIEGVFDGAFDVVLLVVAGEEDGEFRDGGAGGVGKLFWRGLVGHMLPPLILNKGLQAFSVFVSFAAVALGLFAVSTDSGSS